MKKMNILRGIALLLAAIMIFTSIPETALTAYAIEEEAELPAAEETVVEQTGTVEDAQVTTPEAVEPETTDEIQPVEAAPDATGEEVAVEGAATNVTQRSISVTEKGKSFLNSLKYGTELKNEVSFTIKADTADGSIEKLTTKGAYTDFDWTIEDADGDALELPAGVAATQVDNVITFTAIPNQYLTSTTYYLVIKDKSTGHSQVAAADTKISIPIQISAPTITSSSYTSSTLDFNIDDVDGNTQPASQTTTKKSMGYGISTDISSTQSVFEKNVVPKTIELTNTTITDENFSIDWGTDIATYVTKSNAVAFADAMAADQATEDYTVTVGATQALMKDKKVSVSVAPVTGLVTTGNTSTTAYNEYLWFYSPTEKFVPFRYALNFTVTSDLTAEASQTIDGTVKKFATQGTDDFKFSVNKAIDPVDIKVTGGVAPYTVEIFTPSAWDAFDEAAAAPEWMSLDPGTTNDTWVITGMPAAANVNADQVVEIKVTDDYGYSVEKQFQYDVASAVLTYSISDGTNSKELSSDTTLNYNWYAPAGYTNTNYTRTLTIGNPTAKDIMVSINNADSSSTGGNLTITGDFLTAATGGLEKTSIATGETGFVIIAAGGEITAEITVPAAATAGQKSAATVTVAPVTTNEIVTAALKPSFNVTNAGAVITSPEAPVDATSSWTLDSIGTWKVNEANSFTPFVTRTEAHETANAAQKWSLVAQATDTVVGGGTPAQITDGITAENLLKNYGLTFNTENGTISGTPTATGTIHLVYQVNYYAESTDGAVTDTIYRTASLTISNASDLLVLRDADGAEITESYPIGGGYQLASDTKTALTNLVLENTASVDALNTAITITKVMQGTTNVTSNASKYFTVVGGASAKLEAGKTRAFALREATNTEAGGSGTDKSSLLVPGEYTVTLTIASSNVGTQTAEFYITIAKTPVIQYTDSKKAAGVYADSFALGTALAAEDAKKLSVRFFSQAASDTAKRELTYSWAPANAYESLPAGLSLDPATGQIYGTPTKAGTYYVTVTAFDAISKISGSLNVTLTITSKAEIKTVTATVGSDASVYNMYTTGTSKQYVYNGIFTGDAAPDAMTVTVKSGTTAINGNVNIKLYNVLGYNSNSINHFKLSKGTFKSLDSTGKTFTITPYGTSEPGDYAVQVVIDGDEVAPVRFYLFWAVVDPLTVKAIGGPAYTGTVGGAGTAGFGEFVGITSGAGDNQTVTWAEDKGENNKTKIPAGLALYTGNRDDNGVLYAAANKVAYIGGAFEATGTPTTAGTYEIELGASVAADKAAPAAGGLTGIGAANKNFVTYPEQKTTENIAFTITIEPTNALVVSALNASDDGLTGSVVLKSATAGDVDTQTEMRTAGYQDDSYTKTEADGSTTSYTKNTSVAFDRDGYVKTISGYVYKDLAKGYASGKNVVLTVANKSASSIAATAALESGEAFTLAGQNAKGILSLGTIAANGTANITVAPKTKLAAGTYEDTVVISSENAESVTFDISLTVVEASYKVSIAYADAFAKTVDSAYSEVPVVNTVVDKAEDGATAETVKMYTKAGVNGATALGYMALNIKNTGNQVISKITVEEVTSAGASISSAADRKLALSLTSPSASGTNKVTKSGATNVDETVTVCIAPKTNTAQVGTSYLKVSFSTGSSASSDSTIIVPVSYVVYAANMDNPGASITQAVWAPATTDKNDVTSTATANIAKYGDGDAEASFKEGYSAGDGSINVSITAGAPLAATLDAAERSSDERDYTYNLTATLYNYINTGSLVAYNGGAFTLTCEDNSRAAVVDASGNVKAFGYDITEPGTTRTFTVVPRTGLAAGTYKATLGITGNNITTTYYTIQLQVNKENSDVVLDVYASDMEDPTTSRVATEGVVAQSVAERLYNTFVKSNLNDGTPAAPVIGQEVNACENNSEGVTEGTTKVILDNDTTGTDGRVEIVFNVTFPTVTSAATFNTANVTGVTGARVYKAAGTTNEGDITFSLTGMTPNDITGNGYGHYTNSVVFHPYSWVSLTRGGETSANFVDTKAAIEALNDAGNVVYKDADEAFIRVADGSTIGDVVSALPAMQVDLKTFEKYVNAALATETIDTGYGVTKDVVANATFTAAHTMPNPALDADADKIVWTWSEDGTSVSLALTCKTADHTDTVTLTGDYETTLNGKNATANGGLENRIAVTRTAIEEACTVGEGYRYAADVTYDGKNYTSVKEVGDAEGAKGHNWNYNGLNLNPTSDNDYDDAGEYPPVRIKSVDDEGNVTVEGFAVCLDCGEKLAVKTTYATKVGRAATCTADGTTNYYLTVYELDKYGNSTSKTFTRPPFVKTVKATGHKFSELYVDWKVDAETGKITDVEKVYSVCENCGDETVITDYTKEITETSAKVTAKIGNTSLEATAINAADKDCTISAPTWKWADDYSAAYATVKRTINKTQKDERTYSASSTPKVEITTTKAAIYTVYTASVDITDKSGKTVTYTDTQKVLTGNSFESGEEDGYIGVRFGAVNWTGEEDGHMVYTGEAFKPAIIVENGSKRLVLGTDYTVTYKKNTNAGTAIVTIKGKGNYTGTNETLTFTIDQKDIGDDDIKVGGLAVVSGKTLTPVISYSGKALAKGIFDLTAFKNITATSFDEGVAEVEKTIALNPKNKTAANFKGTRTVTVQVVQNKKQLIAIKSATVKKGTVFTYNGDNQYLNSDSTDEECNFTVVGKDGKTLIENEDYELTYSTNTRDAGKVKVVVTGLGLYTGKKTVSYTIKPAKTANIKVTNGDGLEAEYRSTGAKPVLTIADEDLGTLVNGRDYKVSYSKNKKAGTQGIAKVTFLGNYKGHAAISQAFLVKQAVLSEDLVKINIQNELVYNAKSTKAGKYFAEPFITLQDEGTYDENRGSVLSKKEYSVTYYAGETVLDKGTLLPVPTADTPVVITAKITVNPKNANYVMEDGTITIDKTYQVVAPESGAVDLTKAKLAVVKRYKTIGYTGDPITFSSYDTNAQGYLKLTIGKGKNATVLSGSQIEENFSIEYSGNVAKGKGTVIITPLDSSKYAGSVKTTFKITSGSILGLKK